MLIAGLGERAELDAERARIAAAAAAARASDLGSVSISWAAPVVDGVPGALVEGTLLRLYEFDRFKSGDNDRNGVESLEVAGSGVAERELEHARVAAEAANAARDLQNLPANAATPRFSPSARPRSPRRTSRSSSSCSIGRIVARRMGRSPRSPRVPTPSRG